MIKEKAPGSFCPLINKDCIEHECGWYTQVRGTNPNTGKEVDNYGCAVAWLPVLLIENAKESRQMGAAVESFRNEMVKANNNSVLATYLSMRQNKHEHEQIE